MNIEQAACDIQTEVPAEILTSPALLFLYYRIEQILGIKAGANALKTLNNYLEIHCGASFIENPATYEYLLTSREQIFNISKFLTVNETYFFREGVHFDILANALSELIKLGRPIQICCAAVSIGCEAYSIAMLLDYHIRKGLDFDYAIDAFDVDAEVIETAKNARYTSNSLRTDGSSWKPIIDTYLVKEDNEYVVSQNIRRKVRFFPHNIMRGLEKQYDVIFFRNALIYFSSKNRLSVINNLSESLYNNGLLFLGVSETSAVKHPLLANRYSSDGFYFQKTGTPNLTEDHFKNYTDASNLDSKNKPNIKISNIQNFNKKNSNYKYEEIPVNCEEISNLLKIDDGKQNAEFVLDSLKNKDLDSLSGSSLAASAIYFLNTQNFDIADKIITLLENNNSASYTRFLRGEYHYLCGSSENAEKYFHEASVKDKYFWPAFYRITCITADGNPTRHEYKVKKTLESMNLLQGLESSNAPSYECFMGGFSPDYFRRILEKKLS